MWCWEEVANSQSEEAGTHAAKAESRLQAVETEKEVTERSLKKAQERTDGFTEGRSKNGETQIASGILVANTGKEEIKLVRGTPDALWQYNKGEKTNISCLLDILI